MEEVRLIIKLDDTQYFDFCRVVSESADFRHSMTKINNRLENLMGAVARLTGEVVMLNAQVARLQSENIAPRLEA